MYFYLKLQRLIRWERTLLNEIMFCLIFWNVLFGYCSLCKRQMYLGPCLTSLSLKLSESPWRAMGITVYFKWFIQYTKVYFSLGTLIKIRYLDLHLARRRPYSYLYFHTKDRHVKRLGTREDLPESYRHFVSGWYYV